MASINIATAANTANPFLTQSSWYDFTYAADELFEHLPFVPISGPRRRVTLIDIPTAAALGNTGAVPVTPNAADGEDLTVPPGSQARIAYDTLPPVDFFIKRIVAQVDISSFLRFQFSQQNDQLGHQLAAKKLAMRYEYSRMLISGVGGAQNDPEFLGLNALAALVPSQSLIGTNNVPTDLDALLSRIRSGNGRADFVAMSFNAFAVYSVQLRTAGVPLETCWDPVSQRYIPCHAGVPIYRSQFIPVDAIPATPTFPTTIFAGVFGFERGLYGMYQQGIGSNGVQVEHPYFSPDRDNASVRLAWHCGLALDAASALARITEPALPALMPLQ